MSKKNWVPPNTAQEAMMTLEEISSLLQFVKDLSAQPTPPELSAEGYYGFYYFLGFVQDMIMDCHKAIHNAKTESEVNNHVG